MASSRPSKKIPSLGPLIGHFRRMWLRRGFDPHEVDEMCADTIADALHWASKDGETPNDFAVRMLTRNLEPYELSEVFRLANNARRHCSRHNENKRTRYPIDQGGQVDLACDREDIEHALEMREWIFGAIDRIEQLYGEESIESLIAKDLYLYGHDDEARWNMFGLPPKEWQSKFDEVWRFLNEDVEQIGQNRNRPPPHG